MRSIYASEQLSQVIWPDFVNNFKSESSVGSYLSDINEFTDFIKKDFLILSAADVNNYYNEMKSKVANGDIQGNTMAKKFKELHSFARSRRNWQRRFHWIIWINYWLLPRTI